MVSVSGRHLALSDVGNGVQRWDEMNDEVDYTPWRYPASMLESNYCRRPDLDLKLEPRRGMPWCYTDRYQLLSLALSNKCACARTGLLKVFSACMGLGLATECNLLVIELLLGNPSTPIPAFAAQPAAIERRALSSTESHRHYVVLCA